MKNQTTIGETNIVSMRFPKLKMKNVKNLGKSYINTLNKAIAGKKLTDNQVEKLYYMHLVGEDFPIVSNSIVLQLISAYGKKLDYFVEKEYYENAIEFRDIITSLKETKTVK